MADKVANNQATPAGKVDVRDQMSAFLQEKHGKSEKVREETEESDNSEVEDESNPEAIEGDTEEVSEEVTEETGEEETESEAETKPETEKPNKPNRFQRMKARYEGEIQTISTERDKAHYLANLWHNRARGLEQFAKGLLSQIKTGKPVQISDQDLENFQLRSQLGERELQQEFSKTVQKQQAEKKVKAYVDSKTEEFTEAAVGLSTKYKVPADEILEAYAMVSHRPGVTLEKVAQHLRATAVNLGKAPAQKKPLAKRPPTTITPGGGSRVQYKNTEEDMGAWLKNKRAGQAKRAKS